MDAVSVVGFLILGLLLGVTVFAVIYMLAGSATGVDQ